MVSIGVYTSDKELEDLYNSLEKGSLVKMLIEKHRQLEKQVKNLTIPVVVGQSEQLECDVCYQPTNNIKDDEGKRYCDSCEEL